MNLLPDFADETIRSVTNEIAGLHPAGDLIIASIHWGPNWGYEIPQKQRSFAHALVDEANVSVVHGHSSHHAKAIEIYKNRLILYGCGDFLNDYEGIRGHEEFRGDLTLMYFASFDCLTGQLTDLELVPFQIRRFQPVPASGADTVFLQQTLDRESRRFNVRVKLTPEGRLIPFWPQTGTLRYHPIGTRSRTGQVNWSRDSVGTTARRDRSRIPARLVQGTGGWRLG